MHAHIHALLVCMHLGAFYIENAATLSVATVTVLDCDQLQPGQSMLQPLRVQLQPSRCELQLVRT